MAVVEEGSGPWARAARSRYFHRSAAPALLRTEFGGGRWAVLRLAFVTGALTLLTLGLYRFWARTRLRRWYWSAVRPGGHPLEYTGDPLEKLMGFLVAVVVLAFYLGIVNLGLMFASLAILEDHVLPTVATSLGLVPLIFYARYRARRYMLARTRWRGVRFGLEPGAWGYAWRALMHWAITILTAGILWPRMTFLLEKYRTDRTTYGDARLEQGGRWQMLMPGAIPVWIGVIVTACGTLATARTAEMLDPEIWRVLSPVLRLLLDPEWLGPALIATGLALTLGGAVHYAVRSFRVMAEAKRALVGEVRLGLRAAPRTGRILLVMVLGNALSFALVMLVVALAGAAAAQLVLPGGLEAAVEEDPFALLLSNPAAAAVPVALYALAFLVWGAARHAFVTLPKLRHYATTLAVTGAEALHRVRQAERDEAREAGGLAEALDVGGAL
jgi:hypothetical protein